MLLVHTPIIIMFFAKCVYIYMLDDSAKKLVNCISKITGFPTFGKSVSLAPPKITMETFKNPPFEKENHLNQTINQLGRFFIPYKTQLELVFSMITCSCYLLGVWRFPLSRRLVFRLQRLASTSVGHPWPCVSCQVFRPNGPPAANYPVEVSGGVLFFLNGKIYIT